MGFKDWFPFDGEDDTDEAKNMTDPSGSGDTSSQASSRYAKVHRTRLPGATDPQKAVETVLQHEPHPRPRGRVFTAPLKYKYWGTLQGTVNILDRRFNGAEPKLVGIPYDPDTTLTAAKAFETTVLIAPHRRAEIPRLRPFLPYLFKPGRPRHPIGSVRLYDWIDVTDAAPTSPEVVEMVRERRGQWLHGRVKRSTPDFFTFRGPGSHHDAVRGALESTGDVAGGLDDTHGPDPAGTITVCGFRFMTLEEWFEHPKHIPQYDQPDRSSDPHESADSTEQYHGPGLNPSNWGTNGTKSPEAETLNSSPDRRRYQEDPQPRTPGSNQGTVSGGPPSTSIHHFNWEDDGMTIESWNFGIVP